MASPTDFFGAFSFTSTSSEGSSTTSEGYGPSSINRYAQEFFNILDHTSLHATGSLSDFDVYFIVSDNPEHKEVRDLVSRLRQAVSLQVGFDDEWEEPFTEKKTQLVREITTLYYTLSNLSVEAFRIQEMEELSQVYEASFLLLEKLKYNAPLLNQWIDQELNYIRDLLREPFEGSENEHIARASSFEDIKSFLKLIVLYKMVDKCEEVQKSAQEKLDQELNKKHEETALLLHNICTYQKKALLYLDREEPFLHAALKKFGLNYITLQHKKNSSPASFPLTNLEKLNTLASDYEPHFSHLLGSNYLEALLDRQKHTLEVFRERISRWNEPINYGAIFVEMHNNCIKKRKTLEEKVNESFRKGNTSLCVQLKAISVELLLLLNRYQGFIQSPSLHSYTEQDLPPCYFNENHTIFLGYFES